MPESSNGRTSGRLPLNVGSIPTSGTKHMTEDTDNLPVDSRDEHGRFVKGVSGNPAGRLKGTKNKITLARLMLEDQLREMLTDKGPKLMHKAIRMALKGDDKVMRVLLDKMLATPKGDDSDNATDRDVKVIIQNLTDPRLVNRPVIEGQSITIKLPPEAPIVSKESNQSRLDQVPTLTEKSSGLNYVTAQQEPAQEKKVQSRETATKNDKS